MDRADDKQQAAAFADALLRAVAAHRHFDCTVAA
jgi:hypothetical protein